MLLHKRAAGLQAGGLLQQRDGFLRPALLEMRQAKGMLDGRVPMFGCQNHAALAEHLAAVHEIGEAGETRSSALSSPRQEQRGLPPLEYRW